jgi:hypothetical protein
MYSFLEMCWCAEVVECTLFGRITNIVLRPCLQSFFFKISRFKAHNKCGRKKKEKTIYIVDESFEPN